jgi:hypothetical protein
LVFSIFARAQVKAGIKIAADGFPTGQNAPEGAAADLARSFLAHDPAWFRSICIRPYGGGEARAAYVAYLDGVSQHLKEQKQNPSQDDPKEIVQVFAARHLSKDGPASYGYANFEFQDVMFVDVEVKLQSGRRHLRRTLVIKDRDGKWYCHPVPDVSPLLSLGLDEESASVQTVP